MQTDSNTEIGRSTCRTCSEEKPLSEFYTRDSRSGRIRRTECKACHYVRCQEYQRDIKSGRRQKIPRTEVLPEDMRRCAHCRGLKSTTQFPSSCTDGSPRRHSWCRQCLSERASEIRRLNLDAPYHLIGKKCHVCGQLKAASDFNLSQGSPDGRVARCRPCENAAREKRLSHLSVNERSRLRRNVAYKTMYRVTIEQVDAMLAAQDGKCGICGRVLDRVYVDHCHKTKRVRGILCCRCNTRLQSVEDSAFLIRSLAYLSAAYEAHN